LLKTADHLTRTLTWVYSHHPCDKTFDGGFFVKSDLFRRSI